MVHLEDFLPRRTYCVACGYSRGGKLVAQVASCELLEDGGIRLGFPKPHPFAPGDRITAHLDNRTGVESFDASLSVYRGSYRGVVAEAWEGGLTARLARYELYYGSSVVAQASAGGYEHPRDERAELELPRGDLGSVAVQDERERENKLGVLITRSELWPHTTVMAFLSSEADDIFLISHRGSFKSRLLHRDPRCCFAIDHRATFLFERAIDWNFTIIDARASEIMRGSPLFERVQAEFVAKNPWEQPFFTDERAQLIRLESLGILCSGGQRLA